MNALALRHLHQINLPLRMGDVEQWIENQLVSFSLCLFLSLSVSLGDAVSFSPWVRVHASQNECSNNITDGKSVSFFSPPLPRLPTLPHAIPKLAPTRVILEACEQYLPEKERDQKKKNIFSTPNVRRKFSVIFWFFFSSLWVFILPFLFFFFIFVRTLRLAAVSFVLTAHTLFAVYILTFLFLFGPHSQYDVVHRVAPTIPRWMTKRTAVTVSGWPKSCLVEWHVGM